MLNATIIAEYVAENPGCTVSDVCTKFGIDGADAWEFLIEAEQRGLIVGDNSDGGTWHFHAHQ